MDKFDRLYRVTIGALQYEQSLVNIRVCECTMDNLQKGESIFLGSHNLSDGDVCEDWYSNHSSGSNYDITCTITETPYLTGKWRHKDSDGVVLAESQMDIPQATFGDPTILRLVNSTHMRARNDNNTRVMLRSVLDGDVGLFFETKKKDD